MCVRIRGREVNAYVQSIRSSYFHRGYVNEVFGIPRNHLAPEVSRILKAIFYEPQCSAILGHVTDKFLVRRISKLGLTMQTNSPEEFEVFVKEKYFAMKKFVAETGMTLD